MTVFTLTLITLTLIHRILTTYLKRDISCDHL